jgi:hypothetical protein
MKLANPRIWPARGAAAARTIARLVARLYLELLGLAALVLLVAGVALIYLPASLIVAALVLFGYVVGMMLWKARKP